MGFSLSLFFFLIILSLVGFFLHICRRISVASMNLLPLAQLKRTQLWWGAEGGR